MAFNGINSNNSGVNNVYNSIFGYSSNSDTSVTAGGSFSLGDYYMIKNGTYKKLMKAYYASEKENSGDDDSADVTDKAAAKKETQALVNIKTNAASLNNSLEDLRKASLYQPKKDKAGNDVRDENGKLVYDRDKAISAVKSFVESYNAYIKSSDNVENTSVLKKSLKMTQLTAKNSNLLSEIGVKIGENNTLTIDEDKLKEAKLTTISSLFSGSGSYGDQVQNAARQSYQLANSQSYKTNHASSYTYKGNYSLAGYTNGVLDRYL